MEIGLHLSVGALRFAALPAQSQGNNLTGVSFLVPTTTAIRLQMLL